MTKKRTKFFSMPEGDRRREPRETVSDGWVRIYGDTYPLRNWSRSGFLVNSCTADYKIADRVEVRANIPVDADWLEFNCHALVARVEKAREELAGVFLIMDNATRAKIDSHFGVDSAKIRSILEQAGSAEIVVEQMTAEFPAMTTTEILDIAQDLCRDVVEDKLRIADDLQRMGTVIGRAPKDLSTTEKLKFLAERGDREAAGLLFRLRGKLDRRLSDQVGRAINQAVSQGRDEIAEQLILSQSKIISEDRASPFRRREEDRT